jgi:hypothetical protein
MAHCIRHLTTLRTMPFSPPAAAFSCGFVVGINCSVRVVKA